MMQFVRILLPDPVTSNVVFELAQREGWNLVNMIEPDQTTPFEKVWLAGQASVHYIDDGMLGVHYFLIEGKDRETVATIIRASLPTYDDAGIERIVQEAVNPGDQVRAVIYAAVAAPQKYDTQYAGYIRQALASTHAKVRYAAIIMCGFVAWRDLRANLEQIRDLDPNDQLRNLARVVLDNLDRYNWNDTVDADNSKDEGTT